MTDLISRSAALKDAESIDWHHISKNGRLVSGSTSDDVSYVKFDDVISMLKNAPAVDAVPVVRCRDCKWWGLPEGMYATENVKHCEFGRYMVASDGYCVYGEVKSNESE